MLSNEHTKVSPQSAIAVAIIGPWGSGKTTTINQIIETSGIPEDRIGVIIAEFGEVNVDSGRVRGARQREVPNRCVCCHGAEALRDAIDELSPGVELLLIETSGLADGNNVRQVLAGTGLAHSVVALISDAGLVADEDLYGLQVPAADKILITHTAGSALALSGMTPSRVERYLREIDCLDKLLPTCSGIVEQTTWEIIRSVTGSGAALAPQELQNHRAQHQQSVISLLLHSSTTLEKLQDCLSTVVGVDRAKGVITDSSGSRRDFDYIMTNRQDGTSGMTLIVSKDTSRSIILGEVNHIVLFSRHATLKHADFLALGLPNISKEKVDASIGRYPNHFSFFRERGSFPAYSDVGDRYYPPLFAIMERIDQLPPSARLEMTDLWRQMLAGYLSWRCAGLQAIDALREEIESRSMQNELDEAENLISMNLLWHVLHRSGDIEPDMRVQANGLSLGKRFFESMLRLPQPPEFGSSRALTDDYQDMIRLVVSYALSVDSVDARAIHAALEHAHTVDTTNSWRPNLLNQILER